MLCLEIGADRNLHKHTIGSTRVAACGRIYILRAKHYHPGGGFVLEVRGADGRPYWYVTEFLYAGDSRHIPKTTSYVHKVTCVMCLESPKYAIDLLQNTEVM